MRRTTSQRGSFTGIIGSNEARWRTMIREACGRRGAASNTNSVYSLEGLAILDGVPGPQNRPTRLNLSPSPLL
jgi:hypothetical protein